MNLSNKKLNIDYALVQMSYWVTSAVLFCFTTVFLQFRGYSNYEIGIVFAVGNIFGEVACDGNARAAITNASRGKRERPTVKHALNEIERHSAELVSLVGERREDE